MLINVYAAQTVIVLAAAAAVLLAIPEGCRRVFRTWQLLFPPALAALAAVVQLIYPSLLELNQPEMWELSIVAAVIGVARGQFMRVDVDQIWNVVRLPRAPEGLLAAIMLMLFAIIGGAEALVFEPAREPEVPGFHLLIAIGMTMAAAFLIGRASTAWFRIPHVPHQDLIEPEA